MKINFNSLTSEFEHTFSFLSDDYKLIRKEIREECPIIVPEFKLDKHMIKFGNVERTIIARISSSNSGILLKNTHFSNPDEESFNSYFRILSKIYKILNEILELQGEIETFTVAVNFYVDFEDEKEVKKIKKELISNKLNAYFSNSVDDFTINLIKEDGGIINMYEIDQEDDTILSFTIEKNIDFPLFRIENLNELVYKTFSELNEFINTVINFK